MVRIENSKNEHWNILLKSAPYSVKLNSISWRAECLYYRLLALSDDNANYHGNTSTILYKVFPVRMEEQPDDPIDLDIVTSMLNELVEIDLIRFYERERKYIHLVGCKKFLSPNFKKYYVHPKEPDGYDVPKNWAQNQEENPEETEEQPKVETPPTTLFKDDAPKKKGVITFNYGKMKFEGITDDMIKMWSDGYPSLNIGRELIQIRNWIYGNWYNSIGGPGKGRKSNYHRMIVNWLKGNSIHDDKRAEGKSKAEADVAEAKRVTRERDRVLELKRQKILKENSNGEKQKGRTFSFGSENSS